MTGKHMRLFLTGLLVAAAAVAATPKSDVRGLLQQKADVNAQQVDGTRVRTNDG